MKVQRSSYKILSYKIKHDYNVEDFLNNYGYLLQKVINIIWENIEWIEKEQRNYYLIRNGKRFKRKYYHVKESSRKHKRTHLKGHTPEFGSAYISK